MSRLVEHGVMTTSDKLSEASSGSEPTRKGERERATASPQHVRWFTSDCETSAHSCAGSAERPALAVCKQEPLSKAKGESEIVKSGA